jgi:hypothetical protein
MKKAIANLSVVVLSSSLAFFMTAQEALSSTLKFSRLASSPDDGLLIVASRLEIDTVGDIYAIDGINNSLQVDELSRSNNSREAYVVDGFNNSLKVINLSSNNNNNDGRFLWSNFLVLDRNGNVYRSSRITSGETDSVYAIDGINNQLNSKGNGEAYIVDGINNSFQVTNPAESIKGDRQFRWLRSLRINDEGNFDRKREAFFGTDKNVYGVDGLNNQVNLSISQSNREGKTFVFEGINNQPSEISLNRGELPFSFSDGAFDWIDELDLGETNTVYQSREIAISNDENLYFSNGFNNEVKGSLSEGNGDVYFVNGINNFFQIGSPNSFYNEEDNDDAIAIPEREFLTFLNDFARRNGSFSFPDGELPEDFGRAFADGNNPFLSFFDSFENGNFDFPNLNNPDLNGNEEVTSVPESSSLLGFALLGVGLIFSRKKVGFVSRRDSEAQRN